MAPPDLAHLTPVVAQAVRDEDLYREMWLDLHSVQEALRRSRTYRRLAQRCRKAIADDPVDGPRSTVDLLVPILLQELEGPVKNLGRVVSFSLLYSDDRKESYEAFASDATYFHEVLDACADARDIDPSLDDLLGMFDQGRKDGFGRVIRNAAAHADFGFEEGPEGTPGVIFRSLDNHSTWISVEDLLALFDATQDAADALARVVAEALEARPDNAA